MPIIGVRWKQESILHIWCMITGHLSVQVVSVFDQVMPTYHNPTGKKWRIL